jgi:O-antigen/teichoic acid export membrane protein
MKPQGRTQRALLGAALTYGQFIIAIIAAFFVTPLILKTLGARQYGIWLSSGELIGYVLLLDFGVFSILPWLIARADGQKNPDDIRRLLAQGLAVAVMLSALLLLIVFVLWGKLPVILHLGAGDWQELAGPLFLLVVLLAINLPLNIFNPLLGGLQDVGFCGALGLAKTLFVPLVTVVLLLGGHGLYALVIGTALFAPVGGLISFFRARKVAPAAMKEWPRPTWGDATRLFRESIGAWLGGAGVQMMERSSAVVLTFMGNPAIVPTLVCTSRIGQILTQMAWVMPDSALVGFAQLGGENNAARLREVALSIIRLNIVVAAGAACMVLALNPAFVRLWVGEKFFGGLTLNALLAAEVISGSLVHAFVAVVAVHGSRLQIGMATLLQGAVYLMLALILSRQYYLSGLLAADLLAPLFSTIPVSLWLIRSTIGLSLKQLIGDLTTLLILRAGPCLLAAWAYGCWRGQKASLPELAAIGLLVAFVYLQLMASQIASFPLPAGARIWLQRLRVA